MLRYQRALLLSQVEFRDGWVEVRVRLLARFKRPCESDPQIPIDVMVSGDDKEMTPVHACGFNQGIEELRSEVVLVSFSRMGYIPRRKDQIRGTAALAEVLYGLD